MVQDTLVYLNNGDIVIRMANEYIDKRISRNEIKHLGYSVLNNHFVYYHASGIKTISNATKHEKLLINKARIKATRKLDKNERNIKKIEKKKKKLKVNYTLFRGEI